MVLTLLEDHERVGHHGVGRFRVQFNVVCFFASIFSIANVLRKKQKKMFLDVRVSARIWRSNREDLLRCHSNTNN
jgi:hypothetical protein